MLTFERQLWNKGLKQIAGIDEAGRGPLAGPVVAASVVFCRHFLETEQNGFLCGLTDSKKLSRIQRESYFKFLMSQREHVAVGVGFASVAEINNLNILKATHLAMIRAIKNLPFIPDYVLVDGLPVNDISLSSTAIIGGDAKSLTIAAASVIAKVIRDDYMLELDRQYPEYGFSMHKGYGTAAHIQALFEFGPCPAHRQGFRPVRESMAIKRMIRATTLVSK